MRVSWRGRLVRIAGSMVGISLVVSGIAGASAALLGSAVRAWVVEYLVRWVLWGRRVGMRTDLVTSTRDRCRWGRVVGEGGLLNRPDAGGTTSLAYNQRNQTTSINPDGTGAHPLSYKGDGQNHPVQIGAAPTGGTPPNLTENALGIASQTTAGSSGSPATTTYYTRAPDGTLLDERTSSGTYDYVQDANGSTIALTNSAGAVANTYTYDPYGVTTSSTGSAPNSFGFDSGFNAQGGLILFGTRYYDPNLGRWTQPDPDALSLVTDPTQANPYAFAGGDPVDNVDIDSESVPKSSSAPYVCWGCAALSVAMWLVSLNTSEVCHWLRLSRRRLARYLISKS